MTNDQADHDLLVRIDERTARLEKWATNHSEHHFRRELAAWTACIGLIITMIILLLKLH